MSLLEVSGLQAHYADSHILFDVAMRVERNEVVALLGRNGAGKSTTLKSLMGVVTPKSGKVVLDGADLAGKKSHVIARAGMQLVPEDRRIFGSLKIVRDLVNRLPRACRGTDHRAGGTEILAATLALASRVYIIKHGHNVHEGPAGAIKAQPEMLQRYLGV